MSVTSGFFNAIDGDRAYDATQMSSIFDGIIRDGVYETYGAKLMVRPGTGLSVIVGTGRAWFNHTWTLNDADLPLELSRASTYIGDRIDAIVLKVDTSLNVRANSIEVITGEYSDNNPQKPDLPDTETVTHYPLAYVYVKKGAESILQEDIENVIGTTKTPFVIGVLETIDASELYSQWANQWNQFIITRQNEFDAWAAGFQSDTEDWEAEQESMFETWREGQEDDFETWSNNRKDAFRTWFDGVQIIMDDDVAGHLQNEIDDHKEELVYSQNGVHGIRYDSTEETLMVKDRYDNEVEAGVAWLKVINGVPNIVFNVLEEGD